MAWGPRSLAATAMSHGWEQSLEQQAAQEPVWVREPEPSSTVNALEIQEGHPAPTLASHDHVLRLPAMFFPKPQERLLKDSSVARHYLLRKGTSSQPTERRPT